MKTRKEQKSLKTFAFKAWFSKHTYGFLQTVFVILSALSVVWIYFYGDLGEIDSRNLWCKTEGFAMAFLTLLLCGLFRISAGSKWFAFISAVMFGHLLVQIWFLYWGISYMIPLFTAIVITCLYKKIRPYDNIPSRVDIIAACILYWIIPMCGAVTLSGLAHKVFLKKQEYARQAVKLPTVKVKESNGYYIYTEEYGLERMYNTSNVPEGSMVHRLPVNEKYGEIFVVIE